LNRRSGTDFSPKKPYWTQNRVPPERSSLPENPIRNTGRSDLARDNVLKTRLDAKYDRAP
jgi:hypothetical protein